MFDWKDRVDIQMHSDQEARLWTKADQKIIAINRPLTEVATAQNTTVRSSGQKDLMLENVNVQYVGFEARGLVREYKFVVRGATNQTSEYFLEIDNESFSSRQVRFQDGAEICSLRLHRELSAFGNHPPRSHYQIGTSELEDYRKSHSPKAAGRMHKPIVPHEV
jgi:hypothetical protein